MVISRRKTDSIVTTLATILLILMAILGESTLLAQTEVSGGDLESTTWTVSGSPYIVLDTITVQSGETLTIEPGVEVRFEGDALLAVDGILNAEGTESENITFTSNLETPKVKDWTGITFRNADSILRWCIVEYAKNGAYVPWGDATITDCTIRFCERGIVVSAYAVGCTGHLAKATVQRCLIEKNAYFGVYFGGTGDETSGCSIPKTGSAIGELSDSTIRNNGENSSYWNAGVCVSASHGYMTNGFANPLIKSNKIYSNGGSGVRLQGDGTNLAKINGNHIYGNSGSGIRSFQSWGRKEVIGNTITDNNEKGIDNADDRMKIQDNEIKGNDSHGLSTVHVQSITGNEIYNNGGYDLYYQSKLDQLTAFNDWGTTDKNIIDSRIYDKKDDSTLGQVIYDWGKELYFAQFGEGESMLTSEILLLNIDKRGEAQIDIFLRGNNGGPLTVDLNGQDVQGHLQTTIPPGALRTFVTDGKGDLSVGSVTVTSDRTLAGVIKFGGTFGLAGVGSSSPVDHGFLAPLEVRDTEKINTGVAIMNLDEEDREVVFELCDLGGEVLSKCQNIIPGYGHMAIFVGEFDWDVEPDLSDFQGFLKVKSTGQISATVIQTRPNEFATMPVAPLLTSNTDPAQIKLDSFSFPAADSNLEYRLQFAQFGEGEGQIFSQFILCNLNEEAEADIQLELHDDEGDELSVDLNGIEISGEHSFSIPASGMKILQTDGLGPLVVGSATVSANQPIAGVLLFGGNIGVAGVGSSQAVFNGFIAPVETDLQAGINSGVAIMNPNNFWITSSLQFELLDTNGNLLATSDFRMPPEGHKAIHVNEIEWDNSGLDLNQFRGLLKLNSISPIAATIIRTSPGQFATMPVVPIP